jgi:hypothetical protein
MVGYLTTQVICRILKGYVQKSTIGNNATTLVRADITQNRPKNEHVPQRTNLEASENILLQHILV